MNYNNIHKMQEDPTNALQGQNPDSWSTWDMAEFNGWLRPADQNEGTCSFSRDVDSKVEVAMAQSKARSDSKRKGWLSRLCSFIGQLWR